MSAATEPEQRAAMSPHTRRLLTDPIIPLLARLAWPNLLIMMAHASTGLIETWWVARLGSNALAGMTLTFPAVILIQMVSAGAMGGGLSSAVARALGAGRRDDADSIVLHGIVIYCLLGGATALFMLLFGREIYGALGGHGAALDAALAYSDVVFAGSIALWLMNGLASIIRGTGNMAVPALVTCGGILFLLPASPVLIFGLGPIPALGIEGAAAALILYWSGCTAIFAWYILSGRNIACFRWAKLQGRFFRDILRVGGLAAITSLQTNLTIALVTAIVAHAAGIAAVAGFGASVRLEYLLIPLAFGIGGPLVAMVGTNIGAGQNDRAVRIALIGGTASFVLAEIVGLAAAIWPEAWLRLFSDDAATIAAGSAYLTIVGPAYGFFGMGTTLYFASQGAGKLFWPLTAGTARVVIAVGGAWLLLRLTGNMEWMFTALALGLLAHGLITMAAIRGGAWFR